MLCVFAFYKLTILGRQYTLVNHSHASRNWSYDSTHFCSSTFSECLFTLALLSSFKPIKKLAVATVVLLWRFLFTVWRGKHIISISVILWKRYWCSSVDLQESHTLKFLIAEDHEVQVLLYFSALLRTYNCLQNKGQLSFYIRLIHIATSI